MDPIRIPTERSFCGSKPRVITFDASPPPGMLPRPFGGEPPSAKQTYGLRAFDLVVGKSFLGRRSAFESPIADELLQPLMFVTGPGVHDGVFVLFLIRFHRGDL